MEPNCRPVEDEGRAPRGCPADSRCANPIWKPAPICAAVLAAAVVALCPVRAYPAVGLPLVPSELVDSLEIWLDANSEYPRRVGEPELVFVDPDRAEPLNGIAALGMGKLRSLYSPTTATVYLVEPWSPTDPFDASNLLHELVHHRQATAKYWSCERDQEWRAYQLQEAWLTEHNVESGFYWPAIALLASCGLRDVHPD